MRTLRVGAGIGVALISVTVFAQPTTTPNTPGAPSPPPSPSPEPLPLAPTIGLAPDETIEISSEAPAESASSVHLSRDLLRFRSRTQPSDLLRQIPGLVVSQHAGGGKSDQYFIRGFDADHGTDIAIYADGIPVNLTSHGHGQGYADTHWLIPETIDAVDMHKGPYAARFGDFYTAGALELKTIDRVDANTIWIAASAPLASTEAFAQYDRRLVGMASPTLRAGRGDRSLIAMQIAEADGPFLHAQDFRMGNALLKWSGSAGPGQLRLATTWYASRWHQSGQLPSEEIDAGRLDRFGAIDPSEGGIASRASAQLAYSVHDDATRANWHVMTYAVSNRLRLYSNFTLFARDPVDGDQIEQTDARLLYGFDAGYDRWLALGDVDALITFGAQLRADDVETSLWHDAQRGRLAACFAEGQNPCNHTFNRIRNAAMFVEANVSPVAWLHVFPGLRLDQFTWDVEDLDPDTQLVPSATRGGSAQRAIASPKLSFEAEVAPQISLFANSGVGFHSNDARAAVATDGTGALARAYGAELGARVKPHPTVRLSADVWFLHLSSEQVWSGDAGGTEASDATRRLGIDAEATIEPTSWLTIDGNVTFGRSSLVANRGNGGALALAPRVMGSGGVAVHDARSFVSLRTRGIGDRPGNDDGTLTADGYVIFDLIAGCKLTKNFSVEVAINNLLNAKWREAQFAEESRVSPTADVHEQMHFTPGMPATATIKLTGSM